MKLFEHPDFEQAIIRAADISVRGAARIDYRKRLLRTEALRIIEQRREANDF